MYEKNIVSSLLQCDRPLPSQCHTIPCHKIPYVICNGMVHVFHGMASREGLYPIVCDVYLMVLKYNILCGLFCETNNLITV